MAAGKAEMPPQDDLIGFMLGLLRAPEKVPDLNRASCDLYVMSAAYQWCKTFETETPTDNDRYRLTAAMVEASWELVRRGILRPGGTVYPDLNATDPVRFSLTSRGKEWLKSADPNHFIVMQSRALAKALSAYATTFGKSYDLRSQEAIRCREIDAWLATCAMCGAAAESILLALAIGKSGNAEGVHQAYRGASGRKKTVDNLVGRHGGTLQKTFESLMGILSYWRDDAAHGIALTISAAEADEALRHLLQLSQFGADHWKTLTA